MTDTKSAGELIERLRKVHAELVESDGAECEFVKYFREAADEISHLLKARHDLAKERADLLAALESIALWRSVNIAGEYEHGLRDLIRSMTDCAAAALEVLASGPNKYTDHRAAIADLIEQPSVPGVERENLAETIHNARWPVDRPFVPTLFADEDKNGREYCFRIADAILALIEQPAETKP
jgi:hypothetical protein